ncbi:hypothetical protein [Oceaniglobus trochenteri]|uniref:hypothetical protein n=1 Tax=Oceaniglobus trochenteri TaxID=2763260 RepID=UPI001CFF91BD|nr:hypothetical protein [Oceaniglobus trochenteri]
MKRDKLFDLFIRHLRGGPGKGGDTACRIGQQIHASAHLPARQLNDYNRPGQVTTRPVVDHPSAAPHATALPGEINDMLRCLEATTLVRRQRSGTGRNGFAASCNGGLPDARQNDHLPANPRHAREMIAT